MQKTKFITALAVAAALAVCGGVRANAQTADIGQVLFGKTVSLVLTLKDLNSDWRVVSIETKNDGGGDIRKLELNYREGMTNEYYTKGESVMMDGDVYLIAYRRQPESIDDVMRVRDSSQYPINPEALSPVTKLQRSMLNLHTIKRITNVHPFVSRMEISQSEDLRAEVADADNRLKSQGNIRQISNALSMYTMAHNNKLPETKDAVAFKKALMPYIKLLMTEVQNDTVFKQPGTNMPYIPNPAVSKHLLAQIPKPESVILCYEPAPDRKGTRMVLFVDGSWTAISADRWPAVKSAIKIP